MILIGIGANLPSSRHGEPRATCGAALGALEGAGVSVAARSRWYRSAPVPQSDQPWFVNAVVRVRTALGPPALMDLLLRTERAFGRERGERNAPRVLDLDLLAYGEVVIEADPAEGQGGAPVVLPHPRLAERAFVLFPLRDVAPAWRHPVSGLGLDALIQRLPADQRCEAVADAAGAFGTEWQAPERAEDAPEPGASGA